MDTNRNQPDSNGWEVDIHTGNAVSRATGVDEPTGIEYDPVSNTLFISSDAGSGSFIEVVRDFDTPQEQRVQIVEDLGSGDTEDPAYDRVSKNLYFVDGGAATIFRLDPGSDDIFGTGDDLTPVDFDISEFNSGDWEALDWDPRTGNLLLGSRFGQEIYEITDTGADLELVSTISLPENTFPDLDISGLGVAPARLHQGELVDHGSHQQHRHRSHLRRDRAPVNHHHHHHHHHHHTRHDHHHGGYHHHHPGHDHDYGGHDHYNSGHDHHDHNHPRRDHNHHHPGRHHHHNYSESTATTGPREPVQR